jgi:hypothetical protein
MTSITEKVKGFLFEHNYKMFNTLSNQFFSKIFRTVNGLPYTSYFGIRYAQAPVGSLFLQKPVPALPWNDTFIADEEITCLQVIS